MNRLDRLFAITTTLQRKGTVRASELATTFEVSIRTIYRDIGALSEAGIPIVSLPGQGYALAEGFFLPPLTFTTGEAVAVALGTRMFAGHADGRHVAEAKEAYEKIAAVLPANVRREVDELNSIVTIAMPPGGFDLDDPRLLILQQGILEHNVLEIGYRGRYDDAMTEREVEPLELTYFDRAWYLTGYCRLRQDIRTFRVSRMGGVTRTREHFKPRPFERREQRSVEAVVRFAESIVPWVRERQHWAFQQEEEDAAGVVMTYRPNDLREISSWILGWGADAVPLSPPELRDLIKSEAQAVAERLT
jgi:predicted DNA-binding transcriptional regulator YafY